jgi:outer membrane receptor for ferrienterochelin and colicin
MILSTMRYQLIIHLIFLISCSAFSQELFMVRGIVRDSSTHEGIVFANISVTGTQKGTTTDSKGQFQLSLPQGNSILRCSFVGYKISEIPISVVSDVRLSINLVSMDILLQDVTVYAYQETEVERLSESMLSLQSDKIKTMTSVIPDVLRSVQMLPGVSANNEFSAKFNVRGGNQDENLILVNGTQVYDPYHVKEVPNASIGIMLMEMIKKMDIMTGGFPARYGDKMSSVVNIEYREGNKERFTGTASLSMTDVNTVAEGPLGEHGSFILGVRKSYFEYLLKYIHFGSYHNPSFYDLQGVVDYSLGSGQTVLFKFLHAGDAYTQDPLTHHYDVSGSTNTQRSGDSLDNRAQYYSSLLSLQSINILSSSTILRTELAWFDQRENERFWNNDYSNSRETIGGQISFDSSYNAQLYRSDVRIRTMEIGTTLDQQISSLYAIKTGMSYQHITYNQDQLFENTYDQVTNIPHFPDTTILHQTETILDAGFNNRLNTLSWKGAGYVENVVQLSDQLLLNIGGRFDYFDLNKALTWSPRVNLAYRMQGGLTLRGAWGYYFQSPNSRQIAYSAASDTNTQPQKAIHYVFGAGYRFNLDREERSFLNIKVEVYYKSYENLMSANLTTSGLLYYSRKNDAVGSSKGVDLYIMCSIPSFYGWISYGYLSSIQDVLNDVYGSFPRNTDQRHTLAVVGEWELGRQWNFALRFVYGSGYPHTPLSAQYDKNNERWEWVSGSPNSESLPSYSRTDLRISKDLNVFGLPMSTFLDISNVFNIHNIHSYRYTRDGNGNLIKEEMKLWPILPSIGMSVQF